MFVVEEYGFQRIALTDAQNPHAQNTYSATFLGDYECVRTRMKHLANANRVVPVLSEVLR